jgi:hypothetical protein
MSQLQIGTYQATGEPFSFDEEELRYHISLLGTTGSGKTVAAKAIIEEATLAGIPSLLIDPQGDLARMAMLGNLQSIEQHGGDPERAKRYQELAEVRIWTPTKNKGLPLCINPFKAIPENMDPEDNIAYLDVMAGGFTLLAGFKDGQGKTAQVKAFLYVLLSNTLEMKSTPSDFSALADLIQSPHESFQKWGREAELKDLLNGYLKPNDIGNLSKRIRTLDTGINKLMFSSGVPLDIDIMRTPSKKGLIPINIIHMKALVDEQAQQTFLLEISRALYSWMMKLSESDTGMKFLYFIDEVAPYLPPHPYNPPAKDIIKLLFKQGRKYGVSCVLATQNLKDVDYKILDQTHTKILGKITDIREIKNIKELLPADNADTYIEKIPTAETGEFLYWNTKVSERPIEIKTRWLYTDHGMPLNDDDVQKLTSDELREWAQKLSTTPELVQKVDSSNKKDSEISDKLTESDSNDVSKKQSSNKAETVEDEENSSNENDIKGILKSHQTQSEGLTVEVNLLGGLSVLQTTNDPLHMMLGLTNIITALSFLIVDISLFENWSEGNISIFYPMLGLGLTILCGGVFVAESLLRDHASIVKRIRERSRSMHLLVLFWAWALFFLPDVTDVQYSELTEACVIVAQTLITVFFVADITHRFQLKKIDFEFGTSIFDAAKNSAKVLIGAPHLLKIQVSSEILLRNIRLISDALAIYILLVLMDVLPSLSAHAEYDLVLRLFSIMTLNFATELLLRTNKWLDS